jgi:general nucleoside transport system permease protein
MMRAGAFAAAVVALSTGSPYWGLCAGVLAGALLSWLHGWLCIRWRSDQVVVGIAINLVALAGVTVLVESMFGGNTTPSAHALPRLRIPVLDHIPVLGAISGHPITTYLALLVPIAAQLALHRTRWGLRLRAVGEQPGAVATLGLSVSRLRYQGVLLSGALSGLGGATLSLAVLDSFNDLMPYGQGFIALAAMIFGKWSPLGAAGAAAFFAFADALRIGTSTAGVQLPHGLMPALPYLLSLAMLAGFVGRAVAPAADGVPFDPEVR